MKKNINLLLIITILLSFLTPLQSVNASSKTLQDEKNELAQKDLFCHIQISIILNAIVILTKTV